ncbi:MAG: PD40 domain-containing protein, partial [Anaerolineae bacterium]|nr:PD40 domain-containing protein [Anaerolineae bacterium]
MSSKKRFVTIEDVSKIQYVEDPQISPDGQWIAYVQMKANMMKRGYDRNIFLVAASGGAPFQVTFSGKDTTPRWSPDGKQLAFVSARADKPQIYLLPLQRPGEARSLTGHETGAVAPEWSPDGTHIAYLVSSNASERAAENND